MPVPTAPSSSTAPNDRTASDESAAPTAATGGEHERHRECPRDHRDPAVAVAERHHEVAGEPVRDDRHQHQQHAERRSVLALQRRQADQHHAAEADDHPDGLHQPRGPPEQDGGDRRGDRSAARR